MGLICTRAPVGLGGVQHCDVICNIFLNTSLGTSIDSTVLTAHWAEQYISKFEGSGGGGGWNQTEYSLHTTSNFFRVMLPSLVRSSSGLVRTIKAVPRQAQLYNVLLYTKQQIHAAHKRI
jgi:hypothetical protein